MKHYKYIRIILIVIPILILAVLIYKDFNPSGHLKIDYDFCHTTPFISEFSPYGRVLEIEKSQTNGRNQCSQKMVIDPVYFDVRLPQKFDKAQLRLWYQKDYQTPLFIGPSVDLDNWQWQLQDIHYSTSQQAWLVGTASYNLSHIAMDRNRLRFLISSPGLDTSGKQIVFRRIELEFIKDSLSPDNFWPRLKDWLKFIKPYQILADN